MKNEIELEKFYSVLSDLNFKRAGQKVMVFRSFYVVKIVVVACLFVFLNEYPLFSIIFLNFLSLVSIMVVGFTEPYLDKQ